ncbi:DUF2268 domain-containing putative Zn-dependent protease [Sphingobium scionense]|uniref:DUF2268 domain-containing protein n=1 Tax=Sphingobium scionense TaxID=1404341 RepID=A0A7W6LUG4_9SPHN|nr:hypothetical protein [Sphingobium scionense]
MIGAVLMMTTAAAPADIQRTVEVRTSDVATFYRIYDAANGKPSADLLQREYIDEGTDGVRQFVPYRIISGEALAKEVGNNGSTYRQARSCMEALPAVKVKLQGAFQRLADLDPQATFPPVTILVGRNNSGGTTGKSGVLIGLEVACRSSWLQPDLADRLYHLIAHEYGHVEQSVALEEDSDNTTVLKQSLIEGVAELVAELISGQVSNIHLQTWTEGHSNDIGQRFLAEADNTDISDWLYSGVGTPEKPGDLGYWVGYRIAKAYYDKATDKRVALRNLLDLEDPKAILGDSGWQPGS